MKSLIYTGALGPQKIVCGGIPFTAGEPVEVEDTKAEKLLAKGFFTLNRPAKAAKKTRED